MAAPAVLRVTTEPGNNHAKHAEVVQFIAQALDAIPHEQQNHTPSITFVFQQVNGVLSRLQHASKRITDARTKKLRKEAITLFEKRITEWNRMINQHFKDPAIRPLPTINTKTRHVHGHVGSLPETTDTMNLDTRVEGDKNDPLCHVCTHHTASNTYPCCSIPRSGLQVALPFWFKDPKLWVISAKRCSHAMGTPSHACLLPQCCRRNLQLKCQQKHTVHCPGTGSLCGSTIQLKKMLDLLDRPTRNTFTDDMIVDLYAKVLHRDHPTLICYCPSNTCTYASKPFQSIPVDEDHDPLTSIHCDSCNKRHHIHDHKQVCPDKDCGVTFCSVCKMSPYHENQICQGPKDADLANMDDETYKKLIATTKPCPHCKVRIEKSANCDKMTCAQCHGYWCWRCNQKLDPHDPYKHTCLSTSVLAGQQDGAFRDFDYQ